MTGDTITVLTTYGPAATKTWRVGLDGHPKATPYANAKRFRATTEDVGDIRELGRILRGMEPASRSFLVRGAVAEGADPWDMVRRCRARAGEPATLVEVPHHWIMIDLDGIPAPALTDPTNDPEDAVEYLIGLLPEAFQDATCWWQWSSSQGLKAGDTLSAHLWFWLDEPRTDTDLRRWANAVNAEVGTRLVDPAPFNPAQAHYTATPIFAGIADPLPRRSGLRVGEVETVALEVPAALQGVPATATERQGASGEGRGFEARLMAIGGAGGFHAPIKSAVAAWFAQGGAGADANILKARIRGRLAEMDPRALGRAPEDLERYASDSFLDDLIAWTRNRQAEGEEPAPVQPHYPPPSGTAEDARARLQGMVRGFVNDAIAHQVAVAEAEARMGTEGAPVEPPHPPVMAVPVGVGLGKTTAAREAVAHALKTGAIKGPVVFAVPTHRLGQEQVDAFAALGVKAALWRGRSDGRGDDARATCLDFDAVLDAQGVGADIEQSVCKIKTAACPFHGRCPFQAQKPVAAEADVVVTAHDSLFHRRPAAVGQPSLIVLDEAFWQAGLRRSAVSLDIVSDMGTAQVPRDVAATNDLVTSRAKLSRALRATTPGTCVTLAALKNEGLSAAEARSCVTLERRRKVDPGMFPGMGKTARAGAVAHAITNVEIPALVALWRLAAEALEEEHDAAGITVHWKETDAGRYLEAVANWRADLASTWGEGTPILHLDATLHPDLVRLYLPTARILEPVTATAPNMRVCQVLKAPVTAKKLLPPETAPERDRVTAKNSMRDLLAFIRLRAKALRGRGAGGGPDVLVIGQKDAVALLDDAGLPPNVGTAHFNALAGLDRWRGVAGLIVLGRTLPAPSMVEPMVAALTNRPLTARPSGWWYDRVGRGIRMTDGTGRSVQVDVHPDPMADAVRWTICDAELIQAIGRGRGVNRTEADPLAVDVLADVCLPLEVTKVTAWDEVRPTRSDAMRAQGVDLENAADRARAFPDLWGTVRAAEVDRQRTGTNCYYRDPLIAKCACPLRVRYRPVGQGKKTRVATFDPELVPDARVWLTERLGALALFELLGSGMEDAPVADESVVLAAEYSVQGKAGREAAPPAQKPASSEPADATKDFAPIHLDIPFDIPAPVKTPVPEVRASVSEPDDPDAAAVLARLRRYGPATYGTVAADLGIGGTRAWRAEERLRAAGLIHHDTSGRAVARSMSVVPGRQRWDSDMRSPLPGDAALPPWVEDDDMDAAQDIWDEVSAEIIKRPHASAIEMYCS